MILSPLLSLISGAITMFYGGLRYNRPSFIASGLALIVIGFALIRECVYKKDKRERK